MNGKGSRQRPTTLTAEQLAERWAATFGGPVAYCFWCGNEHTRRMMHCSPECATADARDAAGVEDKADLQAFADRADEPRVTIEDILRLFERHA